MQEPHTDRHVPWTEYALLLVLAALWGSSYLFLKLAVIEVPPITLIAARVSMAAMFLLAVMAVRGEPLPAGRTVWARLLLQSVLNSSLAWVVLAWGSQHIPSSLAGVLNSTSPLFVFLLTLGTQGFRPWRALGVMLGLVGVAMVLGVSAADLSARGSLGLAAQGAVLFSALLYACAALHGQKLANVSPLGTATGTMMCATVCLVPLSLWLDAPWRLRPGATAWAALAALALLCTGLALVLYFRLLKTLGSLGVASQSYLRAGFSVLLGFLVLGEAPDVGAQIGLVLSVAGVAWVNMREPRIWTRVAAAVHAARHRP